MKYEWKKQDKSLYLPSTEPAVVKVPAFPAFMLKGEGNPNSAAFAEAVGLLYSLSYAVKMSPKTTPQIEGLHGADSGTLRGPRKKAAAPADYYEYTIFPLEGIWDLNEQGRAKAFLDKDDLVYTLMIRQPDFVTPLFAAEIMENSARIKPHPLNGQAAFGRSEDGLCVQMMHIGPYDTEAASFARMEQYCREQGLRRLSLTHREIYISDARRTAPDKLKTVLRFQVARL
ncbi:GyrI-like domain-containing protein [Paenibacillus tepidiphilus]|uniref:GyrI-like domain-containing protein n=1 Tax=Paenibacillus tepidiphilus TaxID=2608683 RepID=UPI001239F9AE|nr:GyrI-like domain-containing protein [Paenibacillus tepidiphilus]